MRIKAPLGIGSGCIFFTLKGFFGLVSDKGGRQKTRSDNFVYALKRTDKIVGCNLKSSVLGDFGGIEDLREESADQPSRV